ncbi:hypothetical protein FGO68_gene1488 [Halteria grandinella]|uniref:Uncharacterized protein n=1 Tax=Halteria grandinella TaxID=5974 RepID=A0A8J8N9U2_HALGN|nr:hypothetical protein FGO68_gene1488 [Halteria grandinella]
MKRVRLAHKQKKFPFGTRDCCFMCWYMPLSATPKRKASKRKPRIPPILQAVCQGRFKPIIAAKTAPNMPTEEIIMVPQPRFCLDMISDTIVIPAPNSPASPIPAMNRHHLYCSTETMQPFRKFAREQSRMEKKRTESLPFLSPIAPQRIPPRTSPPTCQFKMDSPTSRACSGATPSVAKLDCRTMLKSRMSQMSTKQPRADTRMVRGTRYLGLTFIGVLDAVLDLFEFQFNFNWRVLMFF